MTKIKEQIHFQACNLCEAICGLKIVTRGNEIVSIKGDDQDPLSKGHICPKAIALQDIYNDPERLRQPVRRAGESWEKISWNEAFDEVVSELKQVQDKSGNDAVGIYQGNPSVHSLGVMLFAKHFLKHLHTRNRFSASSVDQLPHHIAAGLMLGHELLIPIPDIDRTQFFLIFGANPIVSNGSMMTAPGFDKRLKALQKRGGYCCVVDPRRTETAARADQHIFIRPGTDAWLLAAMVNVVFENNWIVRGHLFQYADGLDAIKTLVAPWTPENVAQITGVPAESTRALVKQFCEAESAVLYGRMGVSTQQFGSLCQWLIIVFNFITDNLDRPGGAMFTTPAIDVLGSRRKLSKQGSESPSSAFAFNRYRSRSRELPEMQGELPVTTLAEEILCPGEGQIRAMVLIAGNPVLSTPNGRRVAEALSTLDFIVAVDAYINETTRHANIILPPANILERDHYDFIFQALAVRNTARFSKGVFKAPAGVLSDAEIFIELASRMQKTSMLGRMLRSPKNAFLRRWEIRFGINRALKKGSYGKSHSLNLRKLMKAPHGLDFGPLKSCLPQRLFHRNKRIVLAPPEITHDMTRLLSRFEENVVAKGEQGLLLIGRRDPRTCNSWMHNSYRLTKGKPRCLAHLHPDDVRRLNLKTGEPIRVVSRVGSIQLEFLSTDTIKPGVISIPHGWGHNLAGVQMTRAKAKAGVSVNDLTDDECYDAVSGNAVLNGLPVTVERISNAPLFTPGENALADVSPDN